MSEGLRANAVYVEFGVVTEKFAKGLAKAMEDVAKFAGKVEGIGTKLGELGAVGAAGIGGLVLAAAQVNRGVADQLGHIKDLGLTLAADLGELFLPVVKAIADGLSKVVTVVQHMDPGLKAAGASFVGFGTAGLMAMGALGKFAGYAKAALEGASILTQGMGTAFLKIGTMAATAGLPVLAIAAAIGALVLVAGALYNAWSDTSTGFKDSVLGILDTLKGWGQSVAAFFADLFDGVGKFLVKLARGYLDLVAANIRTLAKMLRPVAEFLGMDGAAGFLAEAENLTGDKLLQGLKSGAQMMVSGAKAAGEAIVDCVMYSVEGLKKGASDLGTTLKPLLDKVTGALGLNGTGGPKVRRKTEVEVGTAAAVALPKDLGVDTSIFGMMGRRMVAEARASADAFMEAVRDARSNLISRFKSAFGQVTALIDTFQQGMLAGGGDPLAGVAAVLGELLVQSQQFATLMQMVADFLGMVADTVGAILAPVLPLVGSVFATVGALLKGLVPVLEMTLQPLNLLSPVFMVLAQALTALAPVIALAGQVFTLVTQPLRLLAGPAAKGLFEAVKVVALGFLWVARAVGSVWNGIVGAIQSVLKSLGNISIFGAKPLAFLNDWAKGLQGAMVNTDDLTSAMDTLQATTWEQAQAAAEATVEQGKVADAARRAAESLSNVPSVFKYSLRAFEATDAVSLAPSRSSGTVAGQGGTTVVNDNSTVTIVVQGGNVDAREIAREVQAELKRDQRRRYGTGERIGARYG